MSDLVWIIILAAANGYVIARIEDAARALSLTSHHSRGEI